MGKLLVTDFTTYKYRYLIGYGLIILVLITLLVIAGLYIPGGLSTAEMNATVVSSSLSTANISSLAIIDLPYYLLQKASLAIFGVTIFSIKLPSLILGFASAVGMFFLLRRWFKHNIAVIASAITIATGQFLFVSQNGTPSIMLIFWSIYLLLLAMLIVRNVRHGTLWTFAFFASAALSLYTPLSAYVLLAIGSAAMLHPHLRYMLRRLSKLKFIGAGAMALVLIAPLIYTVIKTPRLGLDLLGVPTTWPNFGTNLNEIATQYLDVISPTSGTIMTPIFGFGSLAFIILGLVHIIGARHTARSYIISVWGLLLVPILLINPSFVSITFVPLVLLLATGVQTLLHQWYRLFPKNPYARVAGLLPLTILVGGLLLSGVERYMYGYHYDPLTATSFSRDLRLLNQELRQSSGNITLVVSEKNKTFYQAVADNKKQHKATTITVTTTAPSTADTIIVERGTGSKTKITLPLQKVITNTHTNEADRFYVYKNTSK
ncbi:hypothetical protein D3C85_482180 [compost metagenome]